VSLVPALEGTLCFLFYTYLVLKTFKDSAPRQ